MKELQGALAVSMRIDIWSDYVCPFCTVGERHLTLALEKFEGAGDVDITWRSFQLDPTAPKHPTEKAGEYLSRSKGMPMEQVEQMNEGLAERAAAVGLDFNWRESVMANTFDAHRVSHVAVEEGKGLEWDALVKQGYFTEGKNVASHEQLREFAAEVGLDAEAVNRVLNSEEKTDAVNEDIALARQVGVQGVPFFVFDGKLAVSGAQPVEVFEQALAQASEAVKG